MNKLSAFTLGLLIATGSSTNAAEIKILSANGARLIMEALAPDFERATGPWQAELLVLPQAFVLTHGALQHASAIAEGMVVDADRMKRNLAMTHGLIVSE